PRRHAMAKRLGPLCHWVREGNPLFEVRPGRGEVAQEEQRVPERYMGLQTMRQRALVLREVVQLLFELPRRWQRSSGQIKSRQAQKRREQLGGLANLRAQLPRPRIG